MKPSYCIICQKKKKGLEVEDNTLIKAVRYVKRNFLKNERGNKLVVCKECFTKYYEDYKRFESRERSIFLLLSIFVILAIISSPTLGSIIALAFIIAVLYALLVAVSVPKLHNMDEILSRFNSK